MNKLDINNENIKNELELICEDIFSENCENTKIYIPINDNDELVIEDALAYNLHYPVKLDDDKEYLRVSLNDIRIYQDEVENEMDLDEYIKEYDDEYQESPEYQEEYKTIEEELIEKQALPEILDAINKAIDDYNYNKQFEVS